MSSLLRTGRIDMAATAACLGALVCWSVGPVFIKSLTGHMDSWTQNMLRYAIAFLFWLPFLVHANARGTFAGSTWRRAVLPSIANVAMQSLWAAGFYYLGAAFMAMLSKTSILWVTGFALVFFREERPLARSPRFWLGFVLSLAGVVGVLYFKDDFAAAGSVTGVIIAMGSAFTWSVYTLSVRVAFRDIDPRSSFSVMSLYTAVGLSACALLFGAPEQAWHLSARTWAIVIVSGITAIALGHVLYYTAIKRIGATIPMLVVLAQPFVVFGLSSRIFHERLNAAQLLSGVVLLVGSGLSIWAQQHLRVEPIVKDVKQL